MKSIIKYLICFLMGIGICSCDYLDVVPDNTATMESAFTDRYMAERFLSTCYWGMPRFISFNENPALGGAFEMIYNREKQTETGMLVALGNNDRSSALMDYWASGPHNSLYATIRNCNTFLENIVKVEDLPATEKQRWINEVKLIKAYCHFYLTIMYGPICVVKESAPVTQSTKGVKVYRDKVDDSFEYALELIEEVIASNALLPSIASTGTELGRFTKPAAYAMKAKILVYWASDLYNGNTELGSFLDHNKEPFFNQTYDQTRWGKAADACKKAIEVCGESGIRLFQKNDYIMTFPVGDTIAHLNALRLSVVQRWNKELIWSTDNTVGHATEEYDCLPRFYFGTIANRFPARGLRSVPFATVDLYYSKNGVPINEDKDYDYAGRFGVRTGDQTHKYFIAVGEKTGAMNFDRELRFYASLGFDRGKWWGNHFDSPTQASNFDELSALFPAGRWGEISSEQILGEYNTTGYWPKKLVAMGTNYTDYRSLYLETTQYPCMRYADLLLLAAEAVNEAEGPRNADKYIDELRARAGLGKVVDCWAIYSKNPTKPTTQAGMRDIIRHERKVELAFEGQYYWDAHRWKTAPTELTGAIQGWNIRGASAEDYYVPTTYYVHQFATPRDYFFPIPESDFINNPLLIQNPGW